VTASDSDTTWVAQGNDTMVCQTFGAIWAWIVSNQPNYKYPVIEITTNTTLDGARHNGRILVCSQSVTLTPVFASMGSGFACSVINLSGSSVTFGAGIVSSSGASVLPAGVSCTMQGVTYSGGSVIYASILGGVTEIALTIPGAVTGLVISGVSSTGVSLAWIAPTAGGTVTSYSVQYKVAGATGWSMANSAVLGTNYSIPDLLASTTYNFAVFGANPAGAGPSSSVATQATSAAVGVLPGQVIGVTISAPTSTTLSLAWSAPSVGTTPIGYTVNYRQTGQTAWTAYASGLSSTSTSITGLSAGTSYDFEVFAANSAGFGPSSSVVTGTTAEW
jgi:Fibronectin type III domain